MKVVFTCKKCKKMQLPDDKKSNKNWKVKPEKCSDPECGGDVEMGVEIACRSV